MQDTAASGFPSLLTLKMFPISLKSAIFASRTVPIPYPTQCFFFGNLSLCLRMENLKYKPIKQTQDDKKIHERSQTDS